MTPLQRIQLRWTLKPVIDTPRDCAITTGYGYRGDLTCNCWILETGRLKLSAQNTAGPCGPWWMQRSLSLLYLPSVCLSAILAACNLPYSYPISFTVLPLSPHSLSLSLSSPSVPARHHYSFFFDPSLRGRIAVWSVCREEIQMHVGVYVCVRESESAY